MANGTLIEGRVWIFPQKNIDADLIFPLEHFFSGKGGITDPQEIRKHAMEGLDPDFVNKVKPGDIVIVGENFGCGSHREQAVSSLKYSGVSLILGKSFSRIYFRNAINLGMPVAQWSGDALSHVKEGDVLRVNLANGIAHNVTRDVQFSVQPVAPVLMRIIEAGGLVPAVQKWGIESWWQGGSSA